MALPLTETDKFLLLSAVGAPETRDRIVALLDLAGTGNVTGPVSSTDNALPRFDGSTGALLQNSGVLVSDANAITGVASLNGVSSATLAFLDATSSIQTQLNARVSGPSSATDSSFILFDGTSGKLIKEHPTLSYNLSTGLITNQKNQNAQLRNILAVNLDSGSGAYAQASVASDAGSINIEADSVAAGGLAQFNVPSGFTGLQIAMAGANPLYLQNNGVIRHNISAAGLVTIGGSGETQIHRINGGTVAAGADTLTFTNGPAGTAGNPDIYLHININGTNYVLPGFAI